MKIRPLAWPAFLLLLLLAWPLAPADEPQLPPLARAAAGVWRVDLDGDTHDDLVVSHDTGYGVYLFVPPEKASAGLEWTVGWTRVMREGEPGDGAALPLLTGTSVRFADGVMQAGGGTCDDRETEFDRHAHVLGRRLAEESAQILAVHELHGQIVDAALFADLKHLRHVLVIERRGQTRFVQEHVDRSLLVSTLRQDHFEHDVALERG